MDSSHTWRRRARPLLGTLVELRIAGDGADADALAAVAFDIVARHHAVMSFHDAASDVRRIGAAAAGETLRVAPDTWRVLDAAFMFEADSGGMFDIAVGAELVRRGLLPGARRLPSAHVPASQALRLEAGDRVRVLQPVSIDLGGIAKGAAVDAALAALRTGGAAAAVVNAGGDLASFGCEPEPVLVRGPGGIRVPAGLLADGAIATSGPYAAGGALVLPGGHAARWTDRSVSVVAPTCLLADALTKIVAALGADAAPLLERHGARAFTVDAAGRLRPLG